MYLPNDVGRSYNSSDDEVPGHFSHFFPPPSPPPFCRTAMCAVQGRRHNLNKQTIKKGTTNGEGATIALDLKEKKNGEDKRQSIIFNSEKTLYISFFLFFPPFSLFFLFFFSSTRVPSACCEQYESIIQTTWLLYLELQLVLMCVYKELSRESNHGIYCPFEEILFDLH